MLMQGITGTTLHYMKLQPKEKLMSVWVSFVFFILIEISYCYFKGDG